MSFKEIMKFSVLAFFMILLGHIPISSQEILSPKEERFSCILYDENFALGKGFEFQNEEISAVVNEQTIIKLLNRYPDAIIEEVFSGNKHLLADLFSRWEKRKYPDERFFWESRAYKLGFLLRFNPEILVETIYKARKEIDAYLVELFCPGTERYRASARVYLLRSRIKALEKFNESELKKIRDILLAKMREKLISIESEDLNQNKVGTAGKSQQEMNYVEHIKELLGLILIPEPILRTIYDVQNCPCQENINALLKALRAEKDKEILLNMMKTYIFGCWKLFLLSGLLDLLQEEALDGIKEAIEVLLYFYLYGDSDVREIISAEYFGPLIRVNPGLCLRVFKENRNMFYAVGFPVDSVATLPRISEVCEYFLAKRAEALNKVKDEDLMSVRDSCISIIKRKLEEVNKSNRWEKLSKNRKRNNHRDKP